ncbi:LOW QUALITY PROTEIN: uncharacterized protein M6G45_015361 [Spheniscus humboldti]
MTHPCIIPWQQIQSLVVTCHLMRMYQHCFQENSISRLCLSCFMLQTTLGAQSPSIVSKKNQSLYPSIPSIQSQEPSHHVSVMPRCPQPSSAPGSQNICPSPNSHSPVLATTGNGEAACASPSTRKEDAYAVAVTGKRAKTTAKFQAGWTGSNLHLLYQALAKCCKIQWLNAKKEDKNNILEAAIKDLKRILQKHPDLDLVFVKLQLAEFYGAKDPAQEEIYKELQERKDTLSPKGRQTLSLYWGKFFLYKKKSLHEAKAKFMDGYKIPVLTEERKECARRLTKCHSGDADATHCFIQETNCHSPAEFAGWEPQAGESRVSFLQS